MTPAEYCWGILQSITQKEPTQIKLLIEKNEYPRLERDRYGYVLRLTIPTKPRENLYALHGMFFDSDLKGEASLWRMFRASLYHLCLHTLHTDFAIYKRLVDEANMNNAMFAISLVEDFAIRGYMRANWPGLVLDTAYANHITALRFRELGPEEDLALRMAANLLSYALTGKPRVPLGPTVGQQIKSIFSKLAEIEAIAYHLADLARMPGKNKTIVEDRKSFDVNKMKTAEQVIDVFDDQSAYLSNIPSFPYTDNYGPNYLFDSSTVTVNLEEKARVLNDSCKAFSIDSPETKLAESDKQVELEAHNSLSEWEHADTIKTSLIESFKGMDPKSHLEEYIFPREDLAEFVRTRSRLIGPIRLIVDQLKMLKTSNDELQDQEAGYVDIPTAIQVMASGKQRNDIFVREEMTQKSEAWAILIDSSKSLENIQGQVKDVAVCLSEVAHDLIPSPSSWACYAFDEKFYVVKDFSESYTNECRGRIGGLSNGIKTLLPDAMRLAAKRLIGSGEDVKVLLVVSDGFPLGYEEIDRDSVETIKQINKSGINLMGLGICSSFMRKYFRSNCLVNNPSELMKNFVKIYMELSNML